MSITDAYINQYLNEGLARLVESTLPVGISLGAKSPAYIRELAVNSGLPLAFFLHPNNYENVLRVLAENTWLSDFHAIRMKDALTESEKEAASRTQALARGHGDAQNALARFSEDTEDTDRTAVRKKVQADSKRILEERLSHFKDSRFWKEWKTRINRPTRKSVLMLRSENFEKIVHDELYVWNGAHYDQVQEGQPVHVRDLMETAQNYGQYLAPTHLIDILTNPQRSFLKKAGAIEKYEGGYVWFKKNFDFTAARAGFINYKKQRREKYSWESTKST